MIETRRREALRAELRQAIEAAMRNNEEDDRRIRRDLALIALIALTALDRNDPSLDVDCYVCNCVVQCDGRLETLKIAHELGYTWNTYTSYLAAKYCTVDVMAYLHENGCPWDSGTFSTAGSAAGGHLEMLKYLFDHGCPWGRSACYNVAYEGNLQCLKFLHEHGCPWDGRTIRYARLAGHIDCLEYARAHGCPEDIIYDDNDDDDDDDDQHELAASISDELPTVMAMIDEHSATLPEGAYVELCGFLRKVHSLVRAPDHEGTDA